MNMLNASGFGTKTIVNNRTERSHNHVEKEMLQELGGEEDNFNSSMVINDNDGSMIINNSMVVNEDKCKPSTFLNKYINGLKHSDSEVENQKQAILKKIADYDQNCLQEVEQVYAKYRGFIT